MICKYFWGHHSKECSKILINSGANANQINFNDPGMTLMGTTVHMDEELVRLFLSTH